MASVTALGSRGILPVCSTQYNTMYDPAQPTDCPLEARVMQPDGTWSPRSARVLGEFHDDLEVPHYTLALEDGTEFDIPADSVHLLAPGVCVFVSVYLINIYRSACGDRV